MNMSKHCTYISGRYIYISFKIFQKPFLRFNGKHELHLHGHAPTFLFRGPPNKV